MVCHQKTIKEIIDAHIYGWTGEDAIESEEECGDEQREEERARDWVSGWKEEREGSGRDRGENEIEDEGKA